MSQSQAMSMCAPSGETMLASAILTSKPSSSGIRASARCSNRMHARQNLQGMTDLQCMPLPTMHLLGVRILASPILQSWLLPCTEWLQYSLFADLHTRTGSTLLKAASHLACCPDKRGQNCCFNSESPPSSPHTARRGDLLAVHRL